MKNRAPIASISVALAISLAFVAPCPTQASDVDEQIGAILERIKERTPRVLQHKDSGKVGETARASIEAVQPISDSDSDKKVKELISAENADREKLLPLLAKKHNTDLKSARQNFALFRFRQAQDNHYFKGLNGKWLTRKDWIEQAKAGGANPFEE